MERTGGNNSARAVGLIAAGLTVVLFFEWHTDEPTVVLPVLLLMSFVAGLAAPRRFVIVGLALGLGIFIAHALSTATGAMVPHYQKQPPATGDWMAMALLLFPATLAAFAGSRLAR